MTGIGVAAVLFGIVFLGLMVTALSKSSGRDGAHRNPHRPAASAENPPGPSSMRNPKVRGSTSAS